MNKNREAGRGSRALSRRHWPLFVLGLLIALYVAYFGWYTLRISDYYQFGGGDLAIYDQAVWNTAGGRLFRQTYQPGWDNLMADHVEPILLPIALLYLLWKSPDMLLLLQTVALALGALPVYWLARDGLRSAVSAGPAPGRQATTKMPGQVSSLLVELSALAFALVYLLYPPLHAANVYEFHPTTLAVPLLLYALFFLRQRRFLLFFAFILLAMGAKEVIPLVTLALGLYILVIRREWVAGLVTIGLSAVWFLVAVFVVIPHFNPGGQSRYFVLGYYSWLGDSGREIVVQAITHPRLVLERFISRINPTYLAGILGPVAYLSLLGLPVLLLAVPTLALNALSDESRLYTPAVYYHYLAPVIPFVIVAAIDGAGFLTRSLGQLAERTLPDKALRTRLQALGLILLSTLILVATVVAQRRHGYLPFSKDFYLPAELERVDALEEIVQLVPPEASVSVERRLASHFSQRERVYAYPDQPDADYQVIDVGNPDWQFHPRDQYGSIVSSLQSGQYGVRDGRHGHLLLERNLDQPDLPEQFYDFVRGDNASPQYELAIDFADELRLVGFDVVWERPMVPRAYLVLYWQALRPIARDLRLFYIQTDQSGEVLPSTELEFAEPVWYPPSRWSTSETFRTETFHWQLAYPKQFGVAVGVVEGPGFWEVEQRLQPVIHSAPWEMGLVHGDTLVWLGTLIVEDQFVELLEEE